MMLSIVIPVYNEEQRIVQTLRAIDAYFHDQKKEIIIVDDGSTDQTLAVIRELNLSDLRIIEGDINRGKGDAVRRGVLESKGEQVLISDADLSTPIRAYEDLLYFLEQFPVVIASRGLKEAEVTHSFHKVFLGKMGNKFIQIILPGIKDSQCGFKLFNGKIARELFALQRLSGFGFDFEILFLARKKNYPIKEVPVTWVNVAGSKVKPIHYLLTLWELGQVLLNNRMGRYSYGS